MNVLIAYLDPGTGSIIMQAVLGGTAGIAVLVKSRGRLFKRKKTDDDSAQAVSGDDTETPAVPAGD